MVRNCSVNGCLENTKRNKNRRFFRFPADELRCRHWIKAVGRTDLESKGVNTLNRSYFVCGLHFADSDCPKKYLKGDAVPTLFLPQLEDSTSPFKHTQPDDNILCCLCQSQISSESPSKEVIKKWVNIRDAFTKSRKKEMGTSGPIKKYIYADQLKFLRKLPLHHSKEDSLSTSSANENSEHVESDDEDDRKPSLEQLNKRLKREMEEPPPQQYFEPETMSPQQQQPEDRHVSFFKGIIPSLYTFTDDESLQFQMGVLQLITNIKQNRFQSHTDS